MSRPVMKEHHPTAVIIMDTRKKGPLLALSYSTVTFGFTFSGLAELRYRWRGSESGVQITSCHLSRSLAAATEVVANPHPPPTTDGHAINII